MTQIGLIGLGHIGSEVARRLAAGDGGVIGYDARAGVAERLRPDGVRPARSLADLAPCDIVVLSLPTSVEVAAVAGELAPHLRPGALVVDMTSGQPDATRRIAAELRDRGLAFVDAPVSGTPATVAAGNATVMLGGEAVEVARARTVMERVAGRVFHVGGVGAGQTLKLMNNTIASGTRLLTFEMIALGARNGVDPATAISVLQHCTGRSYTTDLVFPRHILGDTFEQGFSIGLIAKDTRLLNEMLPDTLKAAGISDGVRRFYDRAIERFGPDADINEIVAVFEEAAEVAIARRRARPA